MKKIICCISLLDFNLSSITQRVNIIFIIYTIYYFLLHFLHLSWFKYRIEVDLQNRSIMI